METMAGFIGGDYHKSEGIGWITTIGVRPEYRRRGIARALMVACEQIMNIPSIRLSVRRFEFAGPKVIC